MSPETIFWPMIILALVTLGVYLPMSKARVAGVKSGKIKARTYKLNEGEPEESLKYSNAIRNQYETPVLFYASCLTAFVSGNAGTAMIVLAWAYALSKTVHLFVHITSN
ncbi:MAG: MAPEG family protein, partial [Pseudomonadota bacterium]